MACRDSGQEHRLLRVGGFFVDVYMLTFLSNDLKRSKNELFKQFRLLYSVGHPSPATYCIFTHCTKTTLNTFVCKAQVHDNLKNLNLEKFMGFNEMNPRVLREFSDVVAKLLSVISEKSWQYGKAPGD